jgi:hypothetical protein
MMPADLMKRVVEACGWRAEGEQGAWAVLGQHAMIAIPLRLEPPGAATGLGAS